MVKIRFKFKIDDFNKNGNLKISSILTHMQNAAIKDAEKYGASHKNLLEDNMFFAVYRNMLKINHEIKDSNEEFTLITFQSSHDRMRFMRSYFIYVSGNEPDFEKECDPYKDALIYCNSIWVLMDMEKRCLLRGSALKYPIEEYTIPFERQFKIIIDNSRTVKVGEFTGAQYYIDDNHHVNNAAYADIINDFSKLRDKISYFDMTYEHEILESDTIEVLSEISENSEKIIGIKKDSKICFCSEIKM